MKVIIIEDEAKASRELKKMLQAIDDTIEVAAILESVKQAMEWLAANPSPDLILSDIQLADGLSFDIYQQVNITSPVIFCTAFDEYLMNAFDTNAVSYLLKPITIEKLEKALDKYKNLKSAFSPQQSMGNLLQSLRLQYKTALLVYLKEKIIPVPVKDMAYVYLEHTVPQIVTLTNQKYSISATMDDLEKVLDPALFYRANRQFLINRNAIANVERFFARKLVARMTVPSPENILVSKAKVTEFLQWLEGTDNG